MCHDNSGEFENSAGPSKIGSLEINQFTLKDGDDIDYKDVDFGEQNEEELDESIAKMIDRSSTLLEPEILNQVKVLVHEHKDFSDYGWEVIHQSTFFL